MEQSSTPLSGRKALVLAASRGIGYACGERFAAMGADVCLVARNQGPLDEAVERLKAASGAKVTGESVDVTDGAGLQSLVQRHRDADVLLTNCGGPPAGRFEDFEAEDWDAAYRLQVRSAITACRVLVPEMAGRGWGRVLMVTSVSVARALPGLILSNGLRPALAGLARSLTREYAARGVTFNLLCPGTTATERMEQLVKRRMEADNLSREEAVQALCQAIPAGRPGKPEEVGATAGFLASPDAAFITGQSFFLDGGLSSV
ncbi:MAG TPA: SDR family oxidoreductase [Gammaproteobacteria bacterium]|nr:SDR family oxidoreductase [Gammaproteobacteria bacterium]